MKWIPVCAVPLYLDLLLHFSCLLGHPLMPDFFLDVATDMTAVKQERYGRESDVCTSRSFLTIMNSVSISSCFFFFLFSFLPRDWAPFKLFDKNSSHLEGMIYGSDYVIKAREEMFPPAGLSGYKMSSLF